MLLLWVINVYANESVRLLSALLLEWEAWLVWFSKFDRIIWDDTINICFHIFDLLLRYFSGRKLLVSDVWVRFSLDELRLALAPLLSIFVEDIVFEEVKECRRVHHVLGRLPAIGGILTQLGRLLKLLELELLLLGRIRRILHLLSIILLLLLLYLLLSNCLLMMAVVHMRLVSINHGFTFLFIHGAQEGARVIAESRVERIHAFADFLSVFGHSLWKSACACLLLHVF